MKKIPMLFVLIALVLSLIVPSNALAADDITDHRFEKDMRSLIEKGILTGYANGKYLPDDSITRAEFAVLIVKALEIEQLAKADFSVAQLSEGTFFTDVEAGDWYYSSIKAASELKIVNGYPDGSYKPDKKISRQEMAVMIMNAINSKGVLTEEAPLDGFSDADKIQSYAVESVQRLLSLEVMLGKQLNGKVFFAPQDDTTRGETAAVINRALKIIYPPKALDYKVATLEEGKDPVIHRKYETLEEAKSKAVNNQVVLKGNTIAWIDSGMAVSNKFTILYTNQSFGSHISYTTSGIEMKYLDSGENWVKVQLADYVGYLKKDTVNLTPDHLIKDRSYYAVSNGDLVHKIYNPITESWGSYIYGMAPSFLSSGNKYYSWNGNTFYNSNGALVGNAYQYFNRMPLYAKTQYTAAQLDDFLKQARPGSPLIGTGSAFKKAEQEIGTNALYFLAHAIHESRWGESKIARDKNNLFGVGAIDSCPYECARSYDSYESGILEVAEDTVVTGYFNERDSRFEGEHLGNKSTGMNVRYASDPYWGQKITGYMYQADKFLSKKYSLTPENGKYNLGVSVADIPVNVRSSAVVNSTNQLYHIPQNGTTVQFLDKVFATGIWYEIAPKNIMGKNYAKAYAYSHGHEPYGRSFDALPLAK
ncbi:S-layer protein [Rossellomorea vietnamensis]|uniref:S-layer protein n=1 Tax=Rossellomorea vietnamensis TaxID=218284 RepID=A0A5D4KGE0_9BACI|nr:S-layer homology domain-containing protein [Rossellomorea vietnamensis]TYR76006.1 S-layer protein [Rossellomorea vietnamensis]